MKTIYVVFGTTGEYSDRSEWMVSAYSNEADAKLHVEKASEYARAWQAFTQTDEALEDYMGTCEKEKTANPMDPCFSCDYTGTKYWYAPIELRDTFTTPEPIQ